MEWNNGAGQPQPANKPVHTGVATRKSKFSLLSLKAASTGLLICIAVLVLALIGYTMLAKPNSQGKYVKSKEMQAVFLNGGQVYFGKITNLNDSYMRMSDIYYLRVNQQVQPNGQSSSNQDISLVKLGCELHGPEDSMVISQQQVVFWENLKTDGQVAKAVADYVKQNPTGQKCTTNNNPSSSTGTGTGAGVDTGTGTGTGTPTPTTTTTKKP